MIGVLIGVLTACTSAETLPGRGETTPAVPAVSTGKSELSLPAATTVAEAGGESIEAGPHNDFAIAAGQGIRVTGVPPGLVRYEASTGEITRRIKIRSAVVQALDAADGRVWVAGLDPDALLAVERGSWANSTGWSTASTPAPVR